MKTAEAAHSRFVNILSEWSAYVNSMEGNSWSKFEGISAKDWTSATNLSWVKTAVSTAELPLKTQWSCKVYLDYISHPVLLPGGPGDKLGGPENCNPAFL